MCVACVGAASPEIAVAIGGYAAVRFGRPVDRVRGWFGRPEPDESTDQLDERTEPAGSK